MVTRDIDLDNSESFFMLSREGKVSVVLQLFCSCLQLFFEYVRYRKNKWHLRKRWCLTVIVSCCYFSRIVFAISSLLCRLSVISSLFNATQCLLYFSENLCELI